MKRWIVTIAFLAVSSAAFGDYTYIVGPSDSLNKLYLYNGDSALIQGRVNDLRLYNTSTALVQGGFVPFFALLDNSSARIEAGSSIWGLGCYTYGASHLEMTGGQIGGDSTLGVYGDSTFSLSGGSVNWMRIAVNGRVNWSGGSIGQISAVDQSMWSVTIFCKDYDYDYATNILTGTWGDDTPFRVLLSDPSGMDDYLYSRIHFITIPEPTTLVLLSLGGLVIGFERSDV